MGELGQQLADHLLVCEKQGKATNERLGRIEGILIAVAGGLIVQLLAIVAYLFLVAYPPGTRPQQPGTTVTTTSSAQLR